MPIVNWTKIGELALPVPSAASFTAGVPWLTVVEVIAGATHLKVSATGSGEAMPGLLAPCGPDGLAGLTLPPERLVLPDAPPGALIGRIGGSSATIKGDGVFVIGGSCATAIAAGSIGPLYVGFNITTRPVIITSLSVAVFGSTPNL